MNLEDKGITVAYDDEEKIIYMEGRNFVSCQFHVESILTQHGSEIIAHSLDYLLEAN